MPAAVFWELADVGPLPQATPRNKIGLFAISERTPGSYSARAYVDGRQISRTFPCDKQAARWRAKAERLEQLRRVVAELEHDVFTRRRAEKLT